MTDYIQIMVTAEKKRDLEKISDILLERRLAACVQIYGPIDSRYIWKQKIEESSEWVCLCKTHAVFFDEIAGIIEENHSYEVPEILDVPVAAVSEKYEKWLIKELKDFT